MICPSVMIATTGLPRFHLCLGSYGVQVEGVPNHSQRLTSRPLGAVPTCPSEARPQRKRGGPVQFSVLVFLLILSFFCIPALAESQLQQTFDGLKEKYLKLRNTDPRLRRAPEWRELADQFVSFVDKNPKFPDCPSALLNASILDREIYLKQSDKGRIMAALELLARLTSDYPDSPLADDALIKRADILLLDLSKVDQAKIDYLGVISLYPKSESAEVARLRLRSIEDGSYKVAKNDSANSTRTGVRHDSTHPLIVLDAGHGGEDFGAVGVGGLLEKDVTLAVALELERILSEKHSATVRLTRTSDVFVPLAERTDLANDFEADLFVSLHVNASPQGKLSGLETFYLDNSHDEASKKLAERENSSMRFEGSQGDLQFMLSDLIQNAKLNDSIKLANLIQRSTFGAVSKKWKTGTTLGVRKGPFYVLVGAHMPCVLVEMFFIDNEVDGPNLSSGKFRRALAEGLASGIGQFIKKAPVKK